jgi:hypothetical protein
MDDRHFAKEITCFKVFHQPHFTLVDQLGHFDLTIQDNVESILVRPFIAKCDVGWVITDLASLDHLSGDGFLDAGKSLLQNVEGSNFMGHAGFLDDIPGFFSG